MNEAGNEKWKDLDMGVGLSRYGIRYSGRRVLSRQALIEKGLFFGPDDRVDMHAFRVRHPLELPDGVAGKLEPRRFASKECALYGMELTPALAAKAFWQYQERELGLIG